MASLTQFFPYVLPHVAGCSEGMAEQTIRSACIELCLRSQILQIVEVDAVTAGVADYAIPLPSSSLLSRVLGVYVNDVSLAPTSMESVREGAALAGTAEQGTPRAYFQRTTATPEVTLYPTPDTSSPDGLLIRAAYAPSRTAMTVPDELFTDWVEAIAAGAVLRLVTTPNHHFSNPKLAPMYAAQFYKGVASATSTARTGRVATAPRVMPVRFM